MTELYLVFAESKSVETWIGEDREPTTETLISKVVRGVANSYAAALGLIYADYVDTLEESGLSQKDYALSNVEDETGEFYVLNLSGLSGTNSWEQTITWYAETIGVNELLEEE
jgi:hypothetical protein